MEMIKNSGLFFPGCHASLELTHVTQALWKNEKGIVVFLGTRLLIGSVILQIGKPCKLMQDSLLSTSSCRYRKLQKVKLSAYSYEHMNEAGLAVP